MRCVVWSESIKHFKPNITNTKIWSYLDLVIICSTVRINKAFVRLQDPLEGLGKFYLWFLFCLWTNSRKKITYLLYFFLFILIKMKLSFENDQWWCILFVYLIRSLEVFISLLRNTKKKKAEIFDYDLFFSSRGCVWRWEMGLG